MSESWHAEPGRHRPLRRRAPSTTSGRRRSRPTWSTCAHCRAQVAGVADQRAGSTTAWAGIVDTLDTPRPTVVERVAAAARRPGRHRPAAGRHPVPPGLVAAGGRPRPRLRHPRRPDRAPTGAWPCSSSLAPLLPVAGVAAAFGPGLDPTWEITAAAPGGRLPPAAPAGGGRLRHHLRAGRRSPRWPSPACRGRPPPGCCPPSPSPSPASPFPPSPPPSGRPPPSPSAWIVAVLASAHETRDVLAAFGAGGQLGLAALAVVAAVLVARRRDAFEIRSQL